MNTRGRPTKLTAAVQRRLCELIVAGNYLDTSAELAKRDMRIREALPGAAPALTDGSRG